MRDHILKIIAGLTLLPSASFDEGWSLAFSLSLWLGS